MLTSCPENFSGIREEVSGDVLGIIDTAICPEKPEQSRMSSLKWTPEVSRNSLGLKQIFIIHPVYRKNNEDIRCLNCLEKRGGGGMIPRNWTFYSVF
jgi:hypothetical protein